MKSPAYTDGEFRESAEEQFDGDPRLKVSLAPRYLPNVTSHRTFAQRDSAVGVQRVSKCWRG